MLWSKHFWPPNSPYLSPLDYYVRSVVERQTDKSKHPNVASFWAAIKAAFAAIDHSETACSRFRAKIERVAETPSEYIE